MCTAPEISVIPLSMKRLHKEPFSPNWSIVLCDTNVPVVHGDPAYPLLTWLMKAYQDNGKLSLDQKHFNYRLSHACVMVEHDTKGEVVMSLLEIHRWRVQLMIPAAIHIHHLPHACMRVPVA